MRLIDGRAAIAAALRARSNHDGIKNRAASPACQIKTVLFRASLDSYTVNSVSGKPNKDGSITVHLGDCDGKRVNCVPLTEGWNYVVRMYQPRKSILDGGWTFPSAKPAK